MKDENEFKIARFLKGHYINESVDLTIGISIGNTKQFGAGLASFVDLVNKNKNIKTLEVLVGAYLQRYYVGEEAAEKKFLEVKNAITPILQKLKIVFTIIDWKEAANNQTFKEDYEKVKALYLTDSEFKKSVELSSKRHTDKGTDEAIRDYLLEECAYFVSKRNAFTYPQNKLNAACVYIMEKFNKDFKFYPYSLFDPKPVKKQEIANQKTSLKLTLVEEVKSKEEFIACCSQFSMLMTKFGIINSTQKVNFFSQFLKKTDECLDLIPKNTGNTYDAEPSGLRVS